MSIYNVKKLNMEEIVLLKILLHRYKEYDKLDILIELVAQPDYHTRDFQNGYKIKKTPEILVQAMPNEVMFCTSDKCEIDPRKMGAGC